MFATIFDLPLLHFIKNNKTPGMSGNTELIGRGKGREGRSSFTSYTVMSAFEKSGFLFLLWGIYSGVLLVMLNIVPRENFVWRMSSLVVSECLAVSPRLGRSVLYVRDMASVRHLRHCKAQHGQLGGLRLPLHFLCHVSGRLCFRQLMHVADRLELLPLVAVGGVERQ